MMWSSLEAYCGFSVEGGPHSRSSKGDDRVLTHFCASTDQDVITRRSKLVSMYKFGGHRVLINMKGDLIVSCAGALAASTVKCVILSSFPRRETSPS